MLCYVYKSLKKEQTYLYVAKRDDFKGVPEPLLTSFGAPQLVMAVDLAGRKQLALTEPEKIQQQLLQNGYYLQLPPPPENELDAYKKRKKARQHEAD